MREQFNLENFLAGKYERVETREGKVVNNLAYFPNYKITPLAGYIEGDLSETEWSGNGAFLPNTNESDYDLFGILKPQQ